MVLVRILFLKSSSISSLIDGKFLWILNGKVSVNRFWDIIEFRSCIKSINTFKKELQLLFFEKYNLDMRTFLYPWFCDYIACNRWRTFTKCISIFNIFVIQIIAAYDACVCCDYLGGDVVDCLQYSMYSFILCFTSSRRLKCLVFNLALFPDILTIDVEEVMRVVSHPCNECCKCFTYCIVVWDP